MLNKLIPFRAAFSGARAGALSIRRRRGKPVLRGVERLEDRRVLSAATLLNEIDVNPPGRSDNRYMYVEIQGTPGASLNNVWFVAIDSGGVPELALNLSGYSLGSDGFAAIKSSTGGFSLPAATTLIPDDSYFQQSGTAGFSQNPTSFYLFSRPTLFRPAPTTIRTTTASSIICRLARPSWITSPSAIRRNRRPIPPTAAW